MKKLVAFHGSSPRLYRIVVLCITGIILAFSIGLNGFQGPEIALHSRIIRRSELSPLDSYLDQNNSYAPLVKRDFQQAAWDKALDKYGKPAITCNLPANKPGKPNYPIQSQWQDTDALGQNGWTVTHPNGLALSPTFKGNIIEAVTGLGVLKGSPPHFFSSQDEEYTVQVGGVNTNFEATFGYYASTIDVNTGLFIAEDNFSPSEMISQNPGSYAPGQQAPALSNWADVTFLQWLQAAQDLGGSDNNIRKRTKNLKYIFRFHIINKESQGIIDHALELEGKELQPWPGHDISMATDQGKAILGSPNGRGVAFFLYQHKNLLGIKTVDKVTIFSTIGTSAETQGDEPWYQAVFTLKDLP